MYWTGISPVAIAAQAIGLGFIVFFGSLMANSRGKKNDEYARSRMDAHFQTLENQQRRTPSIDDEMLRIDRMLASGVLTNDEAEVLRSKM